MPSDMLSDFGHIGRNPGDDHAAALTVCALSADAAEARERLQQLGLIPSPQTGRIRNDKGRWVPRKETA